MAPIPQAVDPADPSQIRQWIRDLRNDDISGNAATAFHALSRHMADAESMLLPVVFRGDEQQRVLATGLVQRYRLSLPGDSPPKGFLYASWKLVGYRGEPIQLHESHDIAVRYLARHAKAAAPLVYRTGGLADQDPSRRLIAAWLMARSGGKHPMDVLSGILIHHLQDNDVWGDAVMACNGLHALGTKVIPYLRMARSTADEQATELINLVETDLINPPRTAEDFRQRSRQQSVTRIYADPAIEYDPQRSGIPHPW